MPSAIIDLTHTIENTISVFPGSASPEIQQLATVARDGYTDILLTMSTHTGTHIDSPAHMIETGKTLDQFEADAFAGAGMMIDCTNAGYEISTDHLMPYEESIGQSEFILLYTGWAAYWETPAYTDRFPALSAQAGAWLARFSLKGIGFDTISADAIDSTSYPNHKSFLSKEIIIIENLVHLDLLIGKKFEILCFPLKIRRSDASPARVLARLYEH